MTTFFPSATAPDDGTTVIFSNRNDWGTGFVADMTIKNLGSAAINGWTVEFDLAANITGIWNASIVSHVGNHYVIHSIGWNDTIAGRHIPSASASKEPPGLNGARPMNVLLNGQSS